MGAPRASVPRASRPLSAHCRRGRRGLVRGRATASAASGIPLDAIRIGHLDGDYRDPRCAWLRQRQIGRTGAVLVRPDRYVAWRSVGASASPRAELGAALSTILSRVIG